MSDYVLEGRGLQMRYDGRLVLDVPTIGVRRAETLAIIGSNGAGKSTLLRVLALLERPTQGQLRLDGRWIAWDAHLLAYRRRFATVFQEPLLVDAPVGRNVALGLTLRRVPRAEITDRTQRWMRRFGVEHLAGRAARTLSGGEAQRVSLARAFAIEPDILLLDEPFAALDPPTRDELLHDLQQVLHESRMTTVFVTHVRDEARRLGDRVAVIMEGQLAQVGTPEEVFDHPVSESVARFVGVENLLAGQVTAERDGLLSIATGKVSVQAVGRVPVGSCVLVCLQPEDLALWPITEAVSHESSLNHLPGRITRISRIGTQYRVEVDCGQPLVALVTKHTVQALHLVPAAAVTVSFTASAAHLIVRQ